MRIQESESLMRAGSLCLFSHKILNESDIKTHISVLQDHHKKLHKCCLTCVISKSDYLDYDLDLVGFRLDFYTSISTIQLDDLMIRDIAQAYVQSFPINIAFVQGSSWAEKWTL